MKLKKKLKNKRKIKTLRNINSQREDLQGLLVWEKVVVLNLLQLELPCECEP